MIPRLLSPRAVALLAALPLAFVAGCLNDDDNPDAGALDEAQDEMAAGLSEMALALDQDIVESVPVLLRDGVDGATLRDTSVSWDPAAQHWRIEIHETYEGVHASGQIDVTRTVQFRADGVPVRFPDENTDEVRVEVEGSNVGNYHRAPRWNADYDLTVDRGWTGVRNADGSIDIDGGGTAGGATTYHVGDRIYPRQVTLTWTTDLAYAAGNPCVAGQLAGTTGRYDFTATFDGAGTASWQVAAGGEVVRSGSVAYVCSGPSAQ